MNEKDTKEKRKLGEIAKDNLQKITIILVSVFYIVQGMFTIVKKDTTIWDILGTIAFSICIGVVISSSLNTMGIKDGRRSKAFQESIRAYGEIKEKATKYFDRLSAWCDYKNHIDLELQKKEIIQNAGLKWKPYKIGYYHEHMPEDFEKRKAIEKADKCKIERLTPQELLSDLPSGRFMKKRFGEGEHEYKTRGLALDLFSKTAIGVVCGLYTLAPLFTQENVGEKMANVVWNTMQIALWLTFGVLKYANAKAFMEDEYRQTHIIQKTEYLNEFYITMQNNPNVVVDYDEEKEIQDYIKELTKEEKESTNEQRKENIPM